jgi:excisionase family DNA binding protein
MAVLGLSRWQIYNLIRSGELESVKVGRSRRVPVAAVDNFVSQLREEAA